MSSSDDERRELAARFARLRPRLRHDAYARERVMSIATQLVATSVRAGGCPTEESLEAETQEAVELAAVAYYAATDFVFG